MKFNLSEVVESVRKDKGTLESFLRLLAVNYKFDLNQVLLLYSQGYTEKEDLTGYSYMVKNSRMKQPTKKYICQINNQNVYLYPVRRIMRQKSGLNFESSNAAVTAFKSTMALNVVHDGDMKEGYNLDDEKQLHMNLKCSPVNYIADTLLQATLDINSQCFSSIFCKDVIEYMWFKKELNSYEIILKLNGKDFYKLLSESYEKYREYYYLYNHKYFSVNEIGILNMCNECKTKEDVFMTLRSISGVNDKLLNKLHNLTRSEFNKLLKVIPEGKLVTYPEYRIGA